MDANEARKISEIIAKSILDNKNVNDVLYQMARVLSYLISEQDERQKLVDVMTKLRGELEGTDKEMGMIHQMEQINKEAKESKEQSQQNRKWLMSIFGVVIGTMLIQLFKIIFTNIK